MSASESRAPDRRLGVAASSDDGIVLLLPQGAREMITASSELYARIARLDGGMGVTEMANPARHLLRQAGERRLLAPNPRLDRAGDRDVRIDRPPTPWVVSRMSKRGCRRWTIRGDGHLHCEQGDARHEGEGGGEIAEAEVLRIPSRASSWVSRAGRPAACRVRRDQAADHAGLQPGEDEQTRMRAPRRQPSR